MKNLALVGAGYWGPNIARSVESTGRGRITWLCDIDEARLDAMGARYPNAKKTTDLVEMLKDESLDAVAISTPVSSHFEVAARCLEAGKHVLVEKPMCETSKKVRDLGLIAKKRGLVLMVGHVFEHNAALPEIKKNIESGGLGEIHYLNFVRTNLGPVRTDVNALWDLASHDISIMCNLMNSVPESVVATGGKYLNRNLDDVVFCNFLFSSGAIANVHASWLNPRKVRSITIVGGKKMAIWDDLNLDTPILIYDKYVEATKPEDAPDDFIGYKTACVDGGLKSVPFKLNQPLLSECDHFIRCMEENEAPSTDAYNGYLVVRCLEAASESLANKSARTRIEYLDRDTFFAG